MICGHPDTEENTRIYIKNDGFSRKVCLTCKKLRKRVGYKTQREVRRELNKMPVDKDAPRRFEEALEAASINPNAPQPLCIVANGEYSKWIDWASDEEMREEGEGSAPTYIEARDMCEGCPLFDLHMKAVIAKRPYHGVNAGLRFELGKRF